MEPFQFHFIARELFALKQRLEIVMQTQAELAATLTAFKDQVTKGIGEVTQKISDLEVAIAAAGNTTPEVDAAVEALRAVAQQLDDIVPDAPIP